MSTLFSLSRRVEFFPLSRDHSIWLSVKLHPFFTVYPRTVIFLFDILFLFVLSWLESLVLLCANAPLLVIMADSRIKGHFLTLEAVKKGINSDQQPSLVGILLTHKNSNSFAIKATLSASWNIHNLDAFTILDNYTFLYSFKFVKNETVSCKLVLCPLKGI